MPDFRITVTVDPGRAVAGARKTDRELNRVANTATRLRRLLVGAFALTGVTVGVGAAIGTLRNFSQEISTVGAVTGATGAEFQRLSDRARELGATTRFTATDAARSLTLLGRAGFTVAESLDTVDDTLQLAQSGALDLATAAGITTAALRGFRLSTSDAVRVTDVLTKAANSANTNVVQLGEGIKFVAPVAAGLNVSLEESVAALSALSDSGLQATLAGTGLRRVLSELESPSTATEKILAQLGLTADQVRVSQVGLTQALQTLKDAGIDTGQALELFGDRGGPAFEILSNAIPRVQELTGALENSAGTAARIAQIMDDNLNGALFAVQSAAEGVILAFGELGGQTFLTQFFRDIADGLRFVGRNLENVGEALAVAGTGLVVFTARTQLAKVGVTSFGDAVLFARIKLLDFEKVLARNPVGLLLIALTAVISALVLFRDEIGLGSNRLATLGDVATVIFTRIQNLLRPLVENFQRGVLAIAEIFDTTVGEIDTSLVGVLTAIAQTVDTIIGLFEGLARVIAGSFKLGFDLAKAIISGEVDSIGAAMNLLGTQVGNNFLQGFNQSRVTDFLQGVVADAERLARERARQAGLAGQDVGGVPAELGPELGPVNNPAATNEEVLTLERVIAGLERERELLMLSNRERQVAVELDRILEQLAKAKVEVGPEQERELEGLIARNVALAEQTQLIDRLRGPTDQYVADLRLLNEAYMMGNITLTEYKELVEALNNELPRTTTLIGGQIERLEQEVGNVNLIFERVAVGGVKVFSDSLLTALRRGNNLGDFFKDLSSGISDLLLQISELLLQLLLLRAVQSATGLPLLQTPVRRQRGGRLAAGQPAIVGEAGPEPFIPDRAGTVLPTESLTPQVNVNVINTTDPDEVQAAIDSGNADQSIVNAIQRNPRLIRNVLGLGGV